jgi:hypothetical protein
MEAQGKSYVDDVKIWSTAAGRISAAETTRRCW